MSDCVGGRRTNTLLVALHLPASASLLGPWGSWVRPHPGLSPQGHLHDRYGQLVNIYTKLLLTKISFHLKVASSGESWGLAPHPTTTLRRVGSVLSPPAPGDSLDRWQGSQKAQGWFPMTAVVPALPWTPTGPPVLSASVSAGSARGGWRLHRLGVGGCFSGPFPPSETGSGTGPEPRGLRLRGGVLSAAPAVPCRPGGDRRGAGEGGWDRCQQHVSPPGCPGAEGHMCPGDEAEAKGMGSRRTGCFG